MRSKNRRRKRACAVKAQGFFQFYRRLRIHCIRLNLVDLGAHASLRNGMALSNAERQARHRARLKARNVSGVTADMILRAVRLKFDAWDDLDRPSWSEMLRRFRKSRTVWYDFLPNSQDGLHGEFGHETKMVRDVAQVVNAVLEPPPAPYRK